MAHKAGDKLQGDVALSNPRCCNKFCLMLQNSMHVVTIVFECSIYLFSMLRPSRPNVLPFYRCCNSCFSVFHSLFFHVAIHVLQCFTMIE